MPTPRTIEQRATETIEIVRSRFEDAVRYAEAYGHEGRTLVVDGSMYSPSTRALPGASWVWEHCTAEDWQTYDEIVGDATEDFTLPEDTDSDAPEDWYSMWEDGCLFAVAPTYDA
jgi:hypothetical protein